jgi:hypothetical protein
MATQPRLGPIGGGESDRDHIGIDPIARTHGHGAACGGQQ